MENNAMIIVYCSDEDGNVSMNLEVKIPGEPVDEELEAALKEPLTMLLQQFADNLSLAMSMELLTPIATEIIHKNQEAVSFMMGEISKAVDSGGEEAAEILKQYLKITALIIEDNGPFKRFINEEMDDGGEG